MENVENPLENSRLETELQQPVFETGKASVESLEKEREQELVKKIKKMIADEEVALHSPNHLFLNILY